VTQEQLTMNYQCLSYSDSVTCRSGETLIAHLVLSPASWCVPSR